MADVLLLFRSIEFLQPGEGGTGNLKGGGTYELKVSVSSIGIRIEMSFFRKVCAATRATARSLRLF
jgi:hypothetical protein